MNKQEFSDLINSNVGIGNFMNFASGCHNAVGWRGHFHEYHIGDDVVVGQFNSTKRYYFVVKKEMIDLEQAQIARYFEIASDRYRQKFYESEEGKRLLDAFNWDLE